LFFVITDLTVVTNDVGPQTQGNGPLTIETDVNNITIESIANNVIPITDSNQVTSVSDENIDARSLRKRKLEITDTLSCIDAKSIKCTDELECAAPIVTIETDDINETQEDNESNFEEYLGKEDIGSCSPIDEDDFAQFSTLKGCDVMAINEGNSACETSITADSKPTLKGRGRKQTIIVSIGSLSDTVAYTTHFRSK